MACDCEEITCNECSPCEQTEETTTCEIPTYTSTGCLPGQHTNCALIDNDDDACVPIETGMTLTQGLDNIISYIKNTLNRLTPSDDSITITPTNDSCDDKATIKVNISEDEGNAIELRDDGLYTSSEDISGVDITPVDTTSINMSATGTANHTISATLIRDTVTGAGDNILVIGANGVYVPPFGDADVCSGIEAVFAGQEQDQANTIDPSDYHFMSLRTPGIDCDAQLLSPPTGFAVTGSDRVSAFGKMEWFDTLTLANASAVAGETVLIFNDTVENLTAKANVNYQGIGQHEIGNFSLSTTDSINNISNIIVTGLFTITTTNTSFLSNVKVVSSSVTIGGTVKGGEFFVGENIIGVGGLAALTHAYVNGRVYLTDFAKVSNCRIEDKSDADGTPAVYLNNATGNEDGISVLSNCLVTSVNNPGIQAYSFSEGSTCIVSNNTVVTNTEIALDILGNGPLSDGRYMQVNSNTARNNGPAPAMRVYQVYAPLSDPLTNEMNLFVTGNSGMSKDGAGIQLIIGNMKNCYGYSENSYGILVDSQENKGSQMSIVDCVGESFASNGIRTLRDTYISGGTYISRLNTSVGNPIRISAASQNAIAPHYYYIVGVKTIARNTSALAIKADEAITCKVAGNIFLNEKLNTAVPGIDPLITNVTVTIDAFGNIR